MKDDSYMPTRLEADARAIVPVHDEIGGTVIYVHGRPAYYVLHGEWFPAVSQPRGRDVDVDDPDDVDAVDEIADVTERPCRLGDAS